MAQVHDRPGRELVPILQDRMIQISYWLYETNPLARWLIDMTAAFICGEGFPIEAKTTTSRESSKVLE